MAFLYCKTCAAQTDVSYSRIYVPSDQGSVALYGVISLRQPTLRVALKQYLSSVIPTKDSILVDSVVLDANCQPAVRVHLPNTSIDIATRLIELGYAIWDRQGAPLSIDFMGCELVSNLAYRAMPKVPKPGANTYIRPATISSTKFVLPLTLTGFLIGIVMTLVQCSRLQIYTKRRVSLAALPEAPRWTKIRGTVTCKGEPLLIPTTGIRAVIVKSVKKRYTVTGWKVFEEAVDDVPCVLDDQTRAYPVSFADAHIRYDAHLVVYNGTAGERDHATPFVDDIWIDYDYVPVGSVVTLIGPIRLTDIGQIKLYSQTMAVAGDERKLVLACRITAFLWTIVSCVGLIMSLIAGTQL